MGADQISKDIKTAFDYQEVDDWKKNTKRWLDFFKGKFYNHPLEKETKYVVNTFYNLINLFVPNLYYQNPVIMVKPKRSKIVKKEGDAYRVIDNVKAAALMESVLNKTLKDIDYETEVRKCVQDALIYGFAIMKVGYSATTVSENDIEYIQDESVFAQRVSPLDFGFDPSSTGPENARYLIHKIVKPLKEVKEEYKNTRDLVGETLDEEKKKKLEKSKEVGDFITLYEHHDQVTGEITTYVKQKNRVLRKKKNPHHFNGSHFVLLKFTGDNDEFRGISMLGTVEDEALALNDAVSLMINHLEIFPGQLMYEKGALDEDELTAIEDGEQGSLLQTQNGAMREGRIQKTSPVPMGSDYFNVQNQLQQLIDRSLGIPDFQRGQGKRKTATEATFEQSDSTIRREYFLNFVKKFVINSCEKIAGLIQQYYDEDREIRIEGDLGVEFVEYSKDDIQGEYDYDFDVQELKFIKQSRVQQIANVLNVMGSHAQTVPAFAQALQEIDGKKLGKEIWKQMDLNFDNFTKRVTVSHLEFSPTQENEIVMSGKRLPDPKIGEDHALHMQHHMPKIMEMMQLFGPENPKTQELSRHAEMHQFMAQQLQGPQPGTPQQQTQQGPQTGGTQQAAQAAPTEPEMAGGFTDNQPELQ